MPVTWKGKAKHAARAAPPSPLPKEETLLKTLGLEGRTVLPAEANVVIRNETGLDVSDPQAFRRFGTPLGRQSFGIIQLDVPAGTFGEFLGTVDSTLLKDVLTEERLLEAQQVTGGPSAPGRRIQFDKEEVEKLREFLGSSEGAEAQRHFFKQRFVDPVFELARQRGVSSSAVRAAMLDRAVHRGVGGLRKILSRVEGEVTFESLIAAEVAGLGKGKSASKRVIRNRLERLAKELD